MSNYTYKPLALAGTLARQLLQRAERYSDEIAELEAARAEAIEALAEQIRAEREAATDRDLVRKEIQRRRDTRLAVTR